MPSTSATPTQDSYRLVSNILDPADAPALELAALYHERWEIEVVFDEFKTHLRANSTVLRSKTPDLVLQELWGLLLAHFAIRQLMAQAAWPRGLDPVRLSFTHAVRVIKRKMSNFGVRHRGELRHQKHQPTPARFASRTFASDNGTVTGSEFIRKLKALGKAPP